MTDIQQSVQTADAGFLMERHNSCLNSLSIIDYLSRRGFDPALLLDGLEKELRGLPDPLAFLKDSNNWISVDVMGKLYANARRMTDDEDVAFSIGYESVTHNKLGYITEILLKVMASPNQALSLLKRINNKFARNKEIELEKLPGNKAIFRLHWHKELNNTRDFCLMNHGVYSAMPTIWGLPPADINETQCQFKGGDCCEYELSWESLPFLKRMRLLFGSKRKLMDQTLLEIERDKHLLETKYSEIESLSKALQQKLDQILSIQQASGAILAELNLGALLPNILEMFITVIEYDRAIIMLVDDEGKNLRYMDGVGEGDEAKAVLRGYEVPLSRSKTNILARVAKTGTPVIADDISNLNLNPENLIISQFNPLSAVVLPLSSKGRVIGVLAADKAQGARARPKLDKEYLEGFANQMALAIENARMYTELKEGFLVSIQALAGALEAKDPYTRGHSDRVAGYSVKLAQRLGLPEDKVEKIRNMCLIHDIGKIGIEGQILNKKDRLLDQEFEHIREHPIIGRRIISPLKLSPEELAVVKHHHERLDGRGYPSGLKAEEIPIHVRIAALCDAFDAMTSNRPYRGSLPTSTAIAELEKGAGTQFDSELVTIFIEMINDGQLDDIMTGHSEEQEREAV